MKTQQGLDVTAASTDEVEAINHFHHQVLSAGIQPDAVLKAAETFPDNFLIQVYAATFYLFAQEDSARKTANEYLHKARSFLPRVNEREAMTYHAAVAWCDKNHEKALNLFGAIVSLYPRDTLALKFSEWLFYCNGQAYNGTRYLKLCFQAAKENEDDPYFLACFSFAYELSGYYKKAYALAERAMAMQPVSPWAHHTIAHVLLMNHEVEGSVRFLEQVRSSWEGIMPLLKGHNSWHLALGYLANRDSDNVLDIYNNTLSGNCNDTVGAQIDMISLLWRMDMAGLPQDAMYTDLLSHLHAHPFEQHTGFNSVHLIYGLARIGKDLEVKQALDDMNQYIMAQKNTYQHEYWQKLVLPFCQATTSFAKQEYSLALERLTPIIEQCIQLGGSDAQCEIFLQMYFICLTQCDSKVKAQRFYKRYLSHYQHTALENYWFRA